MSESLTREMLEQLRKPFPASKISFKVQTKPSEKGNALVVAYLDARDVMERLDEVAGPDWSDRYERIEGGQGLMCYLTIGGVTRADVGDDTNENEPAKSAVSDAFKRAAVKFGVGRFLYDLPRMWAQVKPAGKTFVLADGELEKLQRQVDAALSGKKPAGASIGGASGSQVKPAAKKAEPASSVGPRSEQDLRKQHGVLWQQCTQAGLLANKDLVKAWSINPATSEADIRSRIVEMEAVLKRTVAPQA